MNKTVCIIGAGIGSLSIAALLLKGGVGVTVFEKAFKIGGRTASIIYRKWEQLPNPNIRNCVQIGRLVS
ncbi:MAG TPA: FAD-dependent oxidoreductase [Candidatus Bathyarchaeia archaeon]|nr:FAD-dependent oxidoreductase [Candidatus Bathyarchaeia archaeon]